MSARADAMACQVDDLVLHENRLHAVTSVAFTGFVPPYFGLACLHHPACNARLCPVSHWHLTPIGAGPNCIPLTAKEDRP